MTDKEGECVNVGLLHRNSGAPNADAIVDATRDVAVTYASLERRVARTAGLLERRDIDRGDRVACCFDTEIPFIVAVLAIARVGGVAVPIAVEEATETLVSQLDDSDTSLALLSGREEVQASVIPAIEASDAVTAIGVTAPESALPRFGSETFSILSDRASLRPMTTPAPTATSDPVLQPYTSGSTGEPKGVVLTHGGVKWCTNAFCEHLSLDENERGLVVTPLYHKNAMTGVVKPMLAVGGAVILLSEFDERTTLAAIEKHDVTYMTGVPVVYKRLVADDSVQEYDCTTLSWASCGSQSVPTDLVKSFEDTFDASLLEVYGLTEGGPVVTHSPRPGERRLGSAGTPLPGAETQIVNPEDEGTCSTGEAGELLVASPGVARYHDRPDATADAFVQRQGVRFLRTGDLVWTDEDGYHYVVGRLDDMLVVGGENVYPATVEDRLQRHERVRDAAVVSVPHESKGEAPVAFVIADGVSENELQAHARQAGPTYAVPRRVFFESRLPLTGTGKVDTDALAATARERVGESL